MQQPATAAQNLQVVRLNPLALAFGFGVAGVVEVLLFGAVAGSIWGMMGGAGSGWMHGSAGGGIGSGGWMMGGGYGAGTMMGGGLGLFVYALFCGFFGGAIAGGTAAWVYNAVTARAPTV